ncbi:type II secretion system F family protein [Propionivibrio sp.]|uniref:type II secretion system F family protein n=1 Tax=Propionivibrio sp. TaxID=2212460 RepID=UPI0039E3BD74
MATKAHSPSRIRNALGFGWTQRKNFYRHLAIQSANGVPLERALDSFLPRLHRSRKVYAAGVIATVARRFRDGAPLADALKGFVPPDELAVIRSGELGGTLADSLALIIESADSVQRVRNAIRRAAFTPAVYTVATFVLLWIIGRYVLPDLQQVLPAQRAQGSVALLYALGDVANSLWAALPPAIALACAAWVYWAMPNWTHPTRLAAERFFPFSFYRDTTGFRWLMSFTSLLGAGVPDVEILQMQARDASPWLAQRLRTFHRAMINGTSLSGALLTRAKGRRPYGFPNPDIVNDITSFDGFPDFHINIQALAREWARDLEEKTLLWASRMGFYCEMVLFAVMGLLMVAINDLSSQISHVTGM